MRASTSGSTKLRHVAYAGGWKKFEPLWDWVIRARRVNQMLPLLEKVLAEFGQRSSATDGAGEESLAHTRGNSHPLHSRCFTRLDAAAQAKGNSIPYDSLARNESAVLGSW